MDLPLVPRVDLKTRFGPSEHLVLLTSVAETKLVELLGFLLDHWELDLAFFWCEAGNVDMASARHLHKAAH